MSRTEQGFTLLEVLIALAVFAVVAASSGVAIPHVIGQAQGVRDRLFASWIADNQATEQALGASGTSGSRSIETTFDGRRWTLEERVTRRADHVDVAIDVKDAQGHVLYQLSTVRGRDDTPSN